MLTVMRSRRLRALAMVPVFTMLVAARLSVTPLPETMAATQADVPMRETVTVKQGDVVLRAKVYDTEVVTLEEPISVQIAKFSHDIEAGTKLDPVIVSEETADRLGSGGEIYCGENQRTRSKFAEAMIGDLFSKYETIVRFCFFDSNGDQRLDRVFLAGAKAKEDQTPIDIAPTAFDRRKFQTDDEAGILELRVERFIRKRKAADKIEFKLYLTKNGVEQAFDYIATVDSDGLNKTYPTFKTNPKKVAYPSYFNDVLGAGVGVMGVDAEKGEAQIKVHRGFPMQLFKPVSIEVVYVYVYY